MFFVFRHTTSRATTNNKPNTTRTFSFKSGSVSVTGSVLTVGLACSATLGLGSTLRLLRDTKSLSSIVSS
ncbi:hypothetical protein HanPI659440_Chr04g0176281 [Helianthus annuus]|nr:hypothetical protein HanPI659440_Chr04g0176281 [Helianthus annuus]